MVRAARVLRRPPLIPQDSIGRRLASLHIVHPANPTGSYELLLDSHPNRAAFWQLYAVGVRHKTARCPFGAFPALRACMQSFFAYVGAPGLVPLGPLRHSHYAQT